MRREYAGKLTKEMLIKSGITNITEDGIIYKNDQPMKLITTIGPYKKISIYKFDDNGNKIKADIGRYGTGWYRYDKILIGVHRAIWAWYHNEVPQGFVVDHIDNNKSNNILSNLQLLTQGENLAKDRKKSIWIPTMRRSGYTLEYIEAKIEKITIKYEEAKRNHDADAAHKIRANLAQWKRRKEILFGEQHNV